MSKKIDLVRAWKDPEYRNSLTQEEINELEKNPIGEPLQNMDSILGGQDYPKDPGTSNHEDRIVSHPTETGCGWFGSISAECNGGDCCNPFYSW